MRKPAPRPALAGLLLAASLLLGGCASTAGAQPPVQTNKVTMPPSYRFDPTAIQVAPGTTVTWQNDDHFTHSVSFTGGGFPYLDLAPGKSGSITFSQPGEYDYVCTYHTQDMKGKVVVR